MSLNADAKLSAARETILAWRRGPAALERSLDALVEAFSRGETEAAREAFAAFRTTILEHLREEEEVVFPVATRVLPGEDELIRSLRIAHLCYRNDLLDIQEQIDAGHLQAAELLLGAFAESFRTHERREDQLLKRL